MNYLQMPRVKEDQTLPEILSREETARLLERCENPKHRAMFALAYGSGLWVSEICALRVQDIDSEQMRIFICGSNRNKDRCTILSRQCLRFLRNYWRNFRPSQPDGLLFLGYKNVSHITDKAINQALKKWLTAAGISKNISMHSLWHGFATHLLEDGIESHPPSYVQRKAARSIMDCRTATLDSHIDTCDNCGCTKISCNSCRNRHYPKCRTVAKEKAKF